MDIMAIVDKFGIQIGLVVFFVWWSWVREKHLSQKLDEVQEQRISELVNVVRSNTAAFEMLKVTLDKMNARPCLAEDKK